MIFHVERLDPRIVEANGTEKEKKTFLLCICIFTIEHQIRFFLAFVSLQLQAESTKLQGNTQRWSPGQWCHTVARTHA